MCVCGCVCVHSHPVVKGAVGPVVLSAVRWAEEKLLSTKHKADAKNEHTSSRGHIPICQTTCRLVHYFLATYLNPPFYSDD